MPPLPRSSSPGRASTPVADPFLDAEQLGLQELSRQGGAVDGEERARRRGASGRGSSAPAPPCPSPTRPGSAPARRPAPPCRRGGRACDISGPSPGGGGVSAGPLAPSGWPLPGRAIGRRRAASEASASRNSGRSGARPGRGRGAQPELPAVDPLDLEMADVARHGFQRSRRRPPPPPRRDRAEDLDPSHGQHGDPAVRQLVGGLFGAKRALPPASGSTSSRVSASRSRGWSPWVVERPRSPSARRRRGSPAPASRAAPPSAPDRPAGAPPGPSRRRSW